MKAPDGSNPAMRSAGPPAPDGVFADSCSDARSAISACCDGEAESTPGLVAHLESCASCRDFAAGVGELSRAFVPLRGCAPPADLEQRLLARAARRPRLVSGGGNAMRLAAGLVGLLGVGALGAWNEAGRAPAAPDAQTGWLEPLAGRALHPGDASLRAWSEAMAIVVNEERR